MVRMPHTCRWLPHYPTRRCFRLLTLYTHSYYPMTNKIKLSQKPGPSKLQKKIITWQHYLISIMTMQEL